MWAVMTHGPHPITWKGLWQRSAESRQPRKADPGGSEAPGRYAVSPGTGSVGVPVNMPGSSDLGMRPEPGGSLRNPSTSRTRSVLCSQVSPSTSLRLR